jgi:hypothetical protein
MSYTVPGLMGYMVYRKDVIFRVRDEILLNNES